MLRRLAAYLAILCLTGPLLAQNNVQQNPRIPYTKKATNLIVLPEEGEIRLIVKFNDNVQARPTNDKRVASLTNHDMGNVLALADQTGVTFKRAINHSLDKLATLQNRAIALSKRGQPDLGGIMYVNGPKEVMLQVARALNDMPNVEYVEFEPVWITHQNINATGKGLNSGFANGPINKNSEEKSIDNRDRQSGVQDDDQQGGDPLAGGGFPGCGDPMATPCDTVDEDEEPFCNDVLCCEAVCNIDPTCCEDSWDEACVNWASSYCVGLPVIECGEPAAGSCTEAHEPFHYACDDFECCDAICEINPLCCEVEWDQGCANAAIDMCNQPSCGDPGQRDCFDAHPPNDPFCNDPGCCGSVCSIDPFCCQVSWDSTCANFATLICAGAEVCNQFAGPCFTSHAGTGCEFAECCSAVCEVDPDCCNKGWDAECANIANDTCLTPNFTDIQGYKTLDWYFDAFGNNPPDHLAYPAPSFTGFTGEGHDLPGLWEFGESILKDTGGSQNLTRGKGGRIGIIEHSAWVDHEDLINKVILEPGQTIIHAEGVVISSNHGTATLGIVVAEENGIGITGMAPEAQGYFFPIVSVEEAGRIFSAMTAALLVFEHGDVLSYSIGPPGGTLDSGFTTNLLLRISSDLGIVSCISAGNSCTNLDEDDAAGNTNPDSGAITVGAGFPGVPWCRLGFSNHGDCGGRVHCQSWGSAVTTTGYGGLFSVSTGGDPSVADPRRKYTNDFGGTSAAGPIIAGLALNIQGIAKMTFGIPLMPEQIRGILSGSGFPQCLAFPCEEGVMPGAEDDLVCLGDPTVEEPPNSIGFFPDPPTVAEAVVITQWFDGSPFLDDIEILRGELVSGNKFSLRASDDNRLVIKSVLTNPNDNQALGINYLATGQITDLLIHAHIDEPQFFNSLRILHEWHQTDSPFECDPDFSGFGLTFYEMWDWNQQVWAFVAIDAAAGLDQPVFDCPLEVQLAAPGQRFVRQGDAEMQLRIWTLSLGGNFGGFGGGGTLPYLVRHDWINIQTTGLGGGNQPTPP